MIKVTDSVGILSSAQNLDLQNTSTPFNTKVFFLGIDRGSLETQMHQCGSSSPTALCIGVNPKGRFTSIFYGIDVAPTYAETAIVKAGNQSFRDGDWAQGVKDIVMRAQASQVSRTGASVVIQQPVQTIEKSVPVWPFLLGFGLMALLFLVIWKLLKRTKTTMENLQNEAGEYASRNIEADKDEDVNKKFETVNKPKDLHIYSNPKSDITNASKYPQPFIVTNQSSNNDLVTGVLLGEALSRPAPVIVETPRHHTPSPDYSSSSSSDSGSSSSFGDSFGGGGSSGFGGGGDFGGGGGSSSF